MHFTTSPLKTPGSFHAVKAAQKDFPVLAHHFKSTSEDVLRSGVEKLQSLSLNLQNRDASLVKASHHIHQTNEVLCAMKDQGGKTELKANKSIISSHLKGIDLTETT